jgi:putative membrane protein
MHGYHDFAFGMGIGHISMMLLWVVIIGFVLWALISPKGNQLINRESPLDIAKKRYAKGEITQEELDEIKHNL